MIVNLNVVERFESKWHNYVWTYCGSETVVGLVAYQNNMVRMMKEVLKEYQ
jgi:hypothetical protein